MKTLILAAALISLPVQAQQWQYLESVVPCGPFQEVVRVLSQSQYQEVPIWRGQSDRDPTRFMLFANIERGNFTLVQYHKDLACVLGLGSWSEIVNRSPFALEK